MGGSSVRIRGFTLLELMIVVALAAVILAIGAPNFGEFRRNARLTGDANDFLTAVQVARTEAVKQQRPVSLCATDDPQAADAACTVSADFGGWLVFTDPDTDCSPAATTDITLRGGRAVADRGNVVSAADGACLSFAANGFARDEAPAGARRIVFCDERGYELQGGTGQSAARGIEVSRTGRGEVVREPARLEAWGLACE
ncbi:MAG TPA: GspH/FimT family pseudopilin [Steroidobacteraceae bacterium]|jgi:type IV fimbrial biogenesis protein FimT|nr:GspH/FimT family pseudopilin [Steroidobacteraceae bacterium]